MDLIHKIFVLKSVKICPIYVGSLLLQWPSTLMHFAFWVLEFGVCAQKFSVRGRGTATSLCICACVTYSKVPNNRAANLIFTLGKSIKDVIFEIPTHVPFSQNRTSYFGKHIYLPLPPKKISKWNFCICFQCDIDRKRSTCLS
mgnify:CR=1 FL=1